MNEIIPTMENKQKKIPEKSYTLKVIARYSLASGLFGLFVMIIYNTSKGVGFNTSTWPFIIGISVFCALTSSLAILGSFYLNYLLLKIGIANWVTRQIIDSIFVVLLSIIMCIELTFILNIHIILRQLPFIVTVFVLGCAFGVLLAIMTYRFDKIRQKVSVLEIENKYLAELAEKDQQLKETIKNLAIGEERTRLARELHDSISQGIHGIIFCIHSLRQQSGIDEPKTVEILNHLQKTADSTLDELRAMILELKPSLLEDQGLTTALKNHCELFARRSQININLQLQSTSGLTPGQEMAIYRIAQEALANIQQHAGADQVNISVVKEKQQVRLRIRDNGKGFNKEKIKRGNGLGNMETRCLENAGVLNILTKPGSGTIIEAVFEITG